MPRFNHLRRAKAILLSFLVGFIAIQAGLTMLIETLGCHVIDEEFAGQLRQVHRLCDSFPNRPFILAAGTSRLQLSFDPAELEEEQGGSTFLVYNAALPGFHLPQVLITLRRYLDEGLRPSALVVEINPGFVTWDPPINSPVRLERMTTQEILALAPYTPGWEWTSELIARERTIPSYSLRKKLLLHVLPAWLPRPDAAAAQVAFRKYGGSRVDMPGIDDKHRATLLANARGQYEKSLANFQVTSASNLALRQLLALCQKEAIPVAILLTPEGPTFRGFYRAGAREEFLQWLHSVADLHGVEVIDAWTWCAEEEFFDSHHMLGTAIPSFTRKLWNERLFPWLKKDLKYRQQDMPEHHRELTWKSLVPPG